jgi:hypothetical protein
MASSDEVAAELLAFAKTQQRLLPQDEIVAWYERRDRMPVAGY